MGSGLPEKVIDFVFPANSYHQVRDLVGDMLSTEKKRYMRFLFKNSANKRKLSILFPRRPMTGLCEKLAEEPVTRRFPIVCNNINKIFIDNMFIRKS